MAHTSTPHPSSRRETTRGEFALLALLLAVAAWLRFWGLGALSLQVDEGVQALAVEGWLRTGLPILPSGAVYQRSIPFVALQAYTATALGLDEFALRLPAALFGVAAVAVTFALARSLFDRRVAWVAAAFIALSAWEIELSRYARFYTAFQVSYALALLCFFRGMAPRAWRWRWAFVAAAMAAITLHELSIALATCFLIPLVDRSSGWRTRAASLAAMVPFVVAWRVYRRTAGPWLASQAPPHGLEPVAAADHAAAGPRLLSGLPAIRLPEEFALPHYLDHPTPGFLALIAVVVAVGVLVVRQGGVAGWSRTLLLVAVMACGVAHQFMLAGLALLAYVAWYASSLRSICSRPLWPVYGVLLGSLSYWTLVLTQRLGGDPKATVLALFGFPNVLQYFVYWFAIGWPVFLVLVSVAAVAMFGRYLVEGHRSLVFVPAAIILPIVAASLFESYQESRYVFHIYPLLVILLSWGMLRVAAWVLARLPLGVSPRIALGTLLALGFLVTRDVGPLTWAPMTRTYSTPRDPMRSIISWRAYAGFHQDQAGPARFVREHSGTADGVAAVGAPHQFAVYRFYVGRLDVVLGRPTDSNYQRRRDGRLVDWVTGAEVVFVPRELAGRLPGGSGWLLGDEAILRGDVEYFPEEVKLGVKRVAGDVGYRGGDGATWAAQLH